MTEPKDICFSISFVDPTTSTTLPSVPSAHGLLVIKTFGGAILVTNPGMYTESGGIVPVGSANPTNVACCSFKSRESASNII